MDCANVVELLVTQTAARANTMSLKTLMPLPHFLGAMEFRYGFLTHWVNQRSPCCCCCWRWRTHRRYVLGGPQQHCSYRRAQFVVIVVNDNERSYSPTIGGLWLPIFQLFASLAVMKVSLDWGKEVLHKTPVVGNPIYETLHGMKKGIKDIVAPQGMFEDLGLKYMLVLSMATISPPWKSALAKAKEFGATSSWFMSLPKRVKGPSTCSCR